MGAEPIKLKATTICFQAIGLMSTTFAYTTYSVLIQPWRSWKAWSAFAYVSSQHSGSATLAAGICANAVILRCIEDKPEFKYSEKTTAKGLVILGLAVGGPAWLTMLSAAWLEALVVVLLVVIVGLTFKHYLGAEHNDLWAGT